MHSGFAPTVGSICRCAIMTLDGPVEGGLRCPEVVVNVSQYQNPVEFRTARD